MIPDLGLITVHTVINSDTDKMKPKLLLTSMLICSAEEELVHSTPNSDTANGA